MAEFGGGGIFLDVKPRIDWGELHGELAEALHNELKHIVAKLLRRVCPVCFK